MGSSFDWKKFSFLIRKVIDFKTRTSYTYVNADAWEEVLFFSLKKMGENPVWKLGSHAKGADVVTRRFAISAKSGQIDDGMLVISSYRLTRYGDLKNMIDFLDDERNYDFYLCCARIQDKDERRYIIYKIAADVFIAKDASWKEYSDKKGKSAGYSCLTKNGVQANIVRNMSNQLWLRVPLSLCEKILDVTYLQEEIGSEFDKIFE